MQKLTHFILFSVILVFTISGCADSQGPYEAPSNRNPLLSKAVEVIPAELVEVGGVEFWPYTGTNFLEIRQDPVNFIFTGDADPRKLRAALMFLDGDRSALGLPNQFPFNATWRDAIGGVQTAFGSSSGWVGNPIQLELGAYDPIRFHIRFFDIGDITLGGSHFEILIVGTTNHAVISWELAEQLIAFDFVRTGLVVGSPTITGPINESPFKTINPIIYNNLPGPLRALIGGPPGNVTVPVPRATDGRATVLNLAGSNGGSPIIARQKFVLNFNQVIPKPFCSSAGNPFLLVQGPVKFRQQVVFTPSGNLISQFQANGHLDLLLLDAGGNPVGTPYRAQVTELHKGVMTNNVTLASSFQMFIEIPPAGPLRGQLIVSLNVGPGQSNQFSIEVKCEEGS